VVEHDELEAVEQRFGEMQVATNSRGFCVAITRKPSRARSSPRRGTASRRSSMAGSSTFCTPSGSRFSSFTSRMPPARIASTSGPGTKESRP
jgi:hypothetical protein